ncbi:hypothetical protein BC834DRAFT_902695 [Gloeopeniophorella convolvens]|nr:hypothetical protein BC834DRAFT_902695 [Gloeopeniophorella convolvens]
MLADMPVGVLFLLRLFGLHMSGSAMTLGVGSLVWSVQIIDHMHTPDPRVCKYKSISAAVSTASFRINDHRVSNHAIDAMTTDWGRTCKKRTLRKEIDLLVCA